MIVQYDLSKHPASSDYFSWLVMAKARRATEIVFGLDDVKTDMWSRERVMRRVETMLIPGTEFAGLPCRVGNDGMRRQFPRPNAYELQKFAKRGYKFDKLKSVLAPGKDRYTVTLRQDARIPEKNSNQPAWRQFAKEIGAAVIEDYDVKPMHVHEIMALYAGAKMNFGVNSGQFWLCALSDYPYAVFDTGDENKHPDRAHHGGMRSYFVRYGLKEHEKWAWFNDNQHVIWESDNIDVLRKHFERLQ